MEEQIEHEAGQSGVHGDAAPVDEMSKNAQHDEIAVETIAVDAAAESAAGENGEADVAAVEEATVDETAVEPEIESPEETIARLETELSIAQQEASANLDQMKRVAAEFQNSRRRQEKQLTDAIDRAGAQVVQALLPILDDLDLAFQNVPDGLDEEAEAWVDGFRQIRRKLAELLATQGVEQIPLAGEFDPNLHEAISNEPNEDVESGHIIETLRAGYTHKGRVLRPAMVRVAM